MLRWGERSAGTWRLGPMLLSWEWLNCLGRSLTFSGGLFPHLSGGDSNPFLLIVKIWYEDQLKQEMAKHRSHGGLCTSGVTLCARQGISARQQAVPESNSQGMENET